MSRLDTHGRNGYLAGSRVGVQHPADLPSADEQEAEREACGCGYKPDMGGDYSMGLCALHSGPAEHPEQ